MRLVVLLCGVVAGLVGLGFAWWGEPAALVNIYRLPTPLFASAVLAIHAVSGVSVAGGLMVLASPRVGGMMMLASATTWLLIVALLGGGLGLSMGALIAIGAGGGLLAFLPSLNGAAYRLERAKENEPRVIAESKPERVPEPAPEFVREPTPEFAHEAAPKPAEAQAAYSWRGVIYDTTEDHSKPFTDASQWRFEAPDLPPIDQPEEPEPEPAAATFEPIRPDPRSYERPQPSVSADDQRSHLAYEIHRGQIRPLTLKATRRKRARTRLVVGLSALSVVVIGLPTLLVVDHQMRINAETSVAEAAPPAMAPEKPGGVASTGAATNGGRADAATEVAPPTEARLEAGVLPMVGEPLPMPSEAAALPPLPAASFAYETPFDYCADHRDVDEPDQGVIAAGLPQELIDGLREVTKIPAAEIHWRCMSSAVWVCAQPGGGVACDKVPTPAEREAFCTDHPGAVNIPAAGGSWLCNGIVPVVRGADESTDPRGYDRLAWLGLSREAKGDAETDADAG